jgi:ubiquinone/menaquinone biosynthesis C-methylase UbiE
MRKVGNSASSRLGRHLAVLETMLQAILRKPHNYDAYNRPDIVADYARLAELFPSEIVALDRLRQLMPGPSVLDIGVGGGRTTIAFSEQASRYIGIDYSPAMILACERRFASSAVPLEFCLGDVRQLTYGAGSFNFVLFSYNGIDYLDHNDRLKALREIYRVCAPGGIFCFSSHNMWSLNHVYGAPLTNRRGVYRKLTGILNWAVLRTANPPLRELLSKRHAMVNDGAHGFRLSTYYADPNEVLSQLADVGFDSVTVYDLCGDVVEQPVADNCTDDWLAYFCSRPQIAG